MDETIERRAEAAYAEFRRTRGPRWLAEVFDLVAGELLLFARRLVRDAASAEDLVQQTFLRAIEGAATFDPERRLLPWLLAILTNEGRMAQRRKARPTAPAAASAPETPLQAAERREAEAALAAAFGELPPAYRDVVALRYLHDMRPRHIAAVLELPLATVKTRLQRGVRRLAASLPRSAVFGTVLAALAAPGLAATRRQLLAQAAVVSGVSSVGLLWGVLAMKKLSLAVVAVGVLLGALLGAWLWPVGADSEAGPATSVAAVVRTTAVPIEAPEPDPVGATRILATTNADAVATPEVEAVSIDLRVHAVWKSTREPAGNVPLALQSAHTVLAERWTDAAGVAHFLTSAHPRHWEPPGARMASVTSVLVSGRLHQVDLGRSPQPIVVELEDESRVRGSVVDERGSPVAEADVWIGGRIGAAEVGARTDARGEFELRGKVQGGVVVWATNSAAASAPKAIEDVNGAGRITLRLEHHGCTLEVRVVSDRGPLAGAMAQVLSVARQSGGARATEMRHPTDDLGVVRFSGLAAGDYEVEIAHAMYPPCKRRWSLEDRVGPHTETVRLGASATLNGRVHRRGKPLSGLRVEVDDVASLSWRTTQTDGDGRFHLRDLAIGRVRVSLSRGTLNGGRMVDLAGGEQSMDFELSGGGEVEGRLWLPDGGAAVGWQVSARSVDGISGASHSRTDASGTFRCENVSSQEHRLEVRGPRGGAHVFHGVFADGPLVEFRLPRSAVWQPAALRVRFQDAPAGCSLFPIPGSDRASDSPSGSGLDADGDCSLELAPGRWRLRLDAEEGNPLWFGEVELADGETRDLGLVKLPASGSLVVRLLPLAGLDAAAAHVLLRSTATTDGPEDGPRLRRGTGGTWQAERVPAGQWWLVVRGDGVAPEVRAITVAPDEESHHDVVLSRANPTQFRFAPADPTVEEIGWRSATVRRAADGVIVQYQEYVGPPDFQADLGPGDYLIDLKATSGWHGTARFQVPASGPVLVPLVRD